MANRKDIGDKISELIDSAQQTLHICSPYITNSKALDITKLKRIRELKIICQIKTPATNPKLIRQLICECNAEVRVIDDIHAKVYLSEKKGIIGSANFTNTGIEGKTIEIIKTVSSTERSRLHKWFIEDLWEKSNDDPSKYSSSKWNKLIQQWEDANKNGSGAHNSPHFVDELHDVDNKTIFLFYKNIDMSFPLGFAHSERIKQNLLLNYNNNEIEIWDEGDAGRIAIKSCHDFMTKFKRRHCVAVEFKSTNQKNDYDITEFLKIHNYLLAPMTYFKFQNAKKRHLATIYEIDECNSGIVKNQEKNAEFIKALCDSLLKKKNHWQKHFNKWEENHFGFFLEANQIAKLLDRNL